jgi:hypothetical protein
VQQQTVNASTTRPRISRAAKVLIMGLLITLASAGTIFAAGLSGSQSTKNKAVVIQANPASRTLNQGDSASYTVSFTSANGFSGTVTPTVAGLPANTTAAFAPASVALSAGGTATVTLTVVTSATTPDGRAELAIATAAGDSQAAAVVVQLFVQPTKKTFSIAGDLSQPLSPGATVPLNLSFSNSNDKSLALNSLSVSIASVTRTQAAIDAGLACTPGDYVVTNYSGPYPLSVPVGTSSLQSLGVSTALWPRVTMLDTTWNQDGCKGATIQFTYSGAGEGI